MGFDYRWFIRRILHRVQAIRRNSLQAVSEFVGLGYRKYFSDEGFYVEVRDRLYLLYVEGDNIVKIPGEMLASNPAYAVYKSEMKVMQGTLVLDNAKIKAITQAVIDAFAFSGFDVEICP